uniref:Uncharacterized protein n=1 Tax=Scleropages formosus TaxID=113540 RepID=A0A8C9TQT4_SCLFO
MCECVKIHSHGSNSKKKTTVYMKSKRFMKTPVNNKMAKRGNKKE